MPFTFHWYTGEVPPFTSVAINVTVVPAQTGFWDAVTETLTGNIGFTVIVTGVDVAGLPVGQVTFEVITQVITSLLTGV